MNVGSSCKKKKKVDVRFYRQAYVGNYTSEWDLVGARFRDEMPISPWDAMRYAWESCEALLRDEISVAWLRRGKADSRKRWDVAVVDGAFPECLLGVLHGEGVPTIMLNTVNNFLILFFLDIELIFYITILFISV